MLDMSVAEVPVSSQLSMGESKANLNMLDMSVTEFNKARQQLSQLSQRCKMDQKWICL